MNVRIELLGLPLLTISTSHPTEPDARGDATTLIERADVWAPIGFGPDIPEDGALRGHQRAETGRVGLDTRTEYPEAQRGVQR